MNLKPAMLIVTLLTSSTAYASGGNETSTASNPKWKAECSACHVAYPARLLPAASWKAMMGGLDKHFGTDASLDASSSAEILAFLQQNASRRKPESALKPELRITETRWFQSEHDEVPARLWKDPRVKSAANCAACHTTAENGNFNEHNIRLPK
jgi:cytochrome c553